MKPNTETPQLRAAVYSRFSTDRQTDSSIADQERICGEYAERAGWQVVAHYEDQGISGAAIGNRPGVLQLQEAALARRIDAVLVTDLTRLSRSNGDLSKMIDRLVAKGIRVVGTQDGYDSARKGHKLQAGLSGIIGEAFREMIKDRTYAALESRAKERRPTGGRAYGYRGGKIDASEAAIVREVFERFAAGASNRTIAQELNRRGVPSPGSSWARTVRRASGWMGSGIRVLLRNERYRGDVHWNTSEWRKDCDSGRRQRVMRPRSEWISHTDESLRIISDDLWQRCQRRRQPADENARLKAGGTPRYRLSGLLVCSVCSAHYVMGDGFKYVCSSYINGRACTNHIWVRRDALEETIIGPVEDQLRNPVLVARMAKELEEGYVKHIRETEVRALMAPRELQDLDARLGRLRGRLESGDPDMAPDEIQAAIDRAEGKRSELLEQQPERRQSAKLLAMLPKAAALYLRQIERGLDGEPREALKARIILREMLGPIRLEPGADGSLWANYRFNPAALLKAAGTDGSGGRI